MSRINKEMLDTAHAAELAAERRDAVNEAALEGEIRMEIGVDTLPPMVHGEDRSNITGE